MKDYLKMGQEVVIKGIEYSVFGMIKFKEDKWEWQEYKIVDKQNKVKWLNIEEDEGRLIYSIYEENYAIGNLSGSNVTVYGEEYTSYDQGIAYVCDYWGKVDVDRNERCSYREFINRDNTKIVAIEDWNGEIEKSLGVLLQEKDILITDTFNKAASSSFLSSSPSSGLPMAKIVTIMVSVIVVILFGTIVSSGSIGGVPIDKFLKNSSKFEYVTSVTNSENKIARVYKTTLTVDEAVKAIIDGVPNGITKVADVPDTTDDDKNDAGIGLFSKKEYAFVYTSEENLTYVQVSNKDYVNSSTGAYHSRHSHLSRYYRTYTSNSSSTTYSNYLSSARRSSVRSRSSSGGGISSGK